MEKRGVGDMAALIQFANGVPAIKFSLQELSTCIGRGLDSDICIADKFVSKQHAIIEARQSKANQQQQDYYIRDLDSTNCTYVNDTPVKRARLKDKDIVRIGEEQFVFESSSQEPLCADVMAFPGQEDTVEKQTEDNSKFSRRIKLY
jgi:pSer/pThr/pTyr-binding forkhead associated (FHA) protein